MIAAYSAEMLADYMRAQFAAGNYGFDYEKGMRLYFDKCDEERGVRPEKLKGV